MPFMTDGKRSYSKELRWEKQSKPQRVKERAQRNAAREMLKKEGAVKKGHDVDHKRPLSKGGSNSRSNLRSVPASQNRSVKRNKDGSIR